MLLDRTAARLERAGASMRVTNIMPLGSPLPLNVVAMDWVKTLNHELGGNTEGPADRGGDHTRGGAVGARWDTALCREPGAQHCVRCA
jgi:hypothetical protein